MKKLAPALFALALAAPVAVGQAGSTPTELDRFRLWDACHPMSLIVEGLPSDAVEAGLQSQDIEVAVRSRLRSARIYDEEGISFLYVNVNVVGRAYNISVQYHKLLWDSSTALSFTTNTWATGRTGTHRQDSGFVLSGVSWHVDKFIDEYLRVNGPDCQ